MENVKIGQTIKDRRTKLRLSLEDVGKAVGVHKSTVMRWEKGDIVSLKTSHVYLLSKILYLPVESLLGLTTNATIEDADLIRERIKVQNMVNEIKNKDDLEKLEKYIKVIVLDK